jgi:hypothetical protein
LERKKYHEADRLLRRVLLVDSTNSIALALMDSLPEFDYYAERTAWCNRFDSMLAGTVMPLVEEYLPLDSLAEFIGGDDAIYPDNKEHLFGWTSSTC